MTFKTIFTYLLVFTLTFVNGLQTFTPSKAAAAEGSSSPADFESQKEIYLGLYQTALGGTASNPLDAFSLLRSTFYKENATFTSLSSAGIEFRVIQANENTASKAVKTFRARESLLAPFNASVSTTNSGFELWIEGKRVYEFRIPIDALAVLGNFIVFVEKDTYNKSENFRHISFIDLNYFHLGKGDLPIFKAPIEGTESISQIEVRGNTLYINQTPYEAGLFEFVAQQQRIIINLLANITNPKELLRLIDYAEPYMEYFLANLEEAKQKAQSTEEIDHLQKAFERMQQQLSSGNQENLLQEGLLKVLGENFWPPLKESLDKMNSGLHKQRGLIARTSLLWQQLSVPRPAQVSGIKERLITLAVGVYKRNLSKADLYETAFEIATNKKVRWTTAMLSAAAYAYFLPEASLQHLSTTYEFGRTLLEIAIGKTSEVTNLFWETTKTTFTGLNPIKLYEVYIADGAWKRAGVGVSAMFSIVAIVIGIPHVIVNSYYLAKDFSTSNSLDWNLPERLPRLSGFFYTFKYYSFTENAVDLKTYVQSILPRIVPNFIQRQQETQKAYLQALSDEKRQKYTQTVEESSEELDRQAREFIANFEKEQQAHMSLRKRLVSSSLWKDLSQYVDLKLPFLPVAYQSINTSLQQFKNIENFAGAMAHFLFSFSAFTKSGIFYTTSWNYFFLIRALAFKPKLALTFLFFPNYLNRSIGTELGKITPPSFWNGGSRWIWQEIAQKFDTVNPKEYYQQLRIFETQIVEIEKQVNTAALKEAYAALQKYLKFKADGVLKLAEQKQKLTSNSLGNLSYDAKSFFTVYFDKLVEVAMTSYLRSQAQLENGTDLSTASKHHIKDYFLHERLAVSAEASLNIEAIVKEIAADLTLYEQAKAVVENSQYFVEKQSHRLAHQNYWNLDPERSGQFKRFVNAEKQMTKPSAMARAVRASIVALAVDKPMELALLFLLVAGVDSGPNKPLWDVMFGPDSAFYLSRNVFMGYVSGLIVNIFADVWVKVQTDIRVDSLGGFDTVPEGEYRDKPFRSWYKHVFMTDKNNKWWDHHKNVSSIIYHNIGPAFVLTSITGLLTLGRMDLDFYTLAYVTAFFLPFTGLSSKLEQTFDMASGWVLRFVPKKLHHHPLIIEWTNKEILKLRVSFQLYYKLYENILGQFLGNLTAITTSMSGTRALSRILFGGKTLTERVVETTTTASEYVPMAKPIDRLCRSLFTKNYSSGPLPPAP